MGEGRGGGTAAATGPGFFGIASVSDSTIRCVVTRMRMRRPWHVIAAYRSYRGLQRAMRRSEVPGLLKTAFLIEDARTCCSLSVWDREPIFSAFVAEHVNVVNTVFSRLECPDGGGPELWSTTWRLDAISHNQRWDDLDLIERIGRDRLRPAGEQQVESRQGSAVSTGEDEG